MPEIGGRTARAPVDSTRASVGQLEHLVVQQVADDGDVPLPVDPHGLVVHPHVEPEPSVEGVGGLQQQRRPFFDHPAHVVRQAAVGVGHVTAAFDDGDVGVLEQATQPRGRAHAAGDPSDDDDPHGRHHTPWGMMA